MNELTGNTQGSQRRSFASPASKRRCAKSLASLSKPFHNEESKENKVEISANAQLKEKGDCTFIIVKKRKGKSYNLSSQTKSSIQIKAKPSQKLPSQEELTQAFEIELRSQLYAFFQTVILVSFGKLKLEDSKTEVALSIITECSSKAPGAKLIGKLAKEVKKHKRKERYSRAFETIKTENPWILAQVLSKKISPLIQFELHKKEDISGLCHQTMRIITHQLKSNDYDSLEDCLEKIVYSCNSILLSG